LDIDYHSLGISRFELRALVIVYLLLLSSLAPRHHSQNQKYVPSLLGNSLAVYPHFLPSYQDYSGVSPNVLLLV